MAATSLAITLYAAPTHLAAAGVLALTPLGTTNAPLPPAPRKVALAHTSLKCVGCAGPHEAHSAQCPDRPAPEPHEEGREDDEMH